MSIGLNTSYTNYYDTYSDSKTESLKDSLASKDLKNSSDEELMEVCKSFESYFVEQMYKAMEKTIDKEEEEDTMLSASAYTDYFGDMLTQEYAELATDESDFGIAKLLYEQLKRNVSEEIVPAKQENKVEQTDTSSDASNADSSTEAQL